MFDHVDLLARIYERLIPPPDPDVLGPLLGLSVEHALLDAAGGTGRVSGALAASAGRVVVCDASPRMLEQARKGLFRDRSSVLYLIAVEGSVTEPSYFDMFDCQALKVECLYR